MNVLLIFWKKNSAIPLCPFYGISLEQSSSKRLQKCMRWREFGWDMHCARMKTASGRSAGRALTLRSDRQADRALQDRVGSSQLSDLFLKLLDPLRLVSGGSRPQTTIDLGLLDPGAQSLGVDTQLLADCGSHPRPAPAQPTPPTPSS